MRGKKPNVEKMVLDQTTKISIVGAGLAGATFAYLANQKGFDVTVYERDQIGGACYTDVMEGIPIHCYGPHIFHTSDEEVMKFFGKFTELNDFVNRPKAFYRGKFYTLPFNLETWNQVYGTQYPQEMEIGDRDQKFESLEDYAIKVLGKKMYRILVKGYTEKQWGTKAKNLPPEILGRLPIRKTFDSNYFNDKYQGVPPEGYTQVIKRMLAGIKVVKRNIKSADELDGIVVWSGSIDQCFNFSEGTLEYRGAMFLHFVHQTDNYQGNAVINFTDKRVKCTRVTEHRHFYPGVDFGNVSVITHEVPSNIGKYYPVPTQRNLEILEKYKKKSKDIIFIGRSGLYQYMNMDKTIASTIAIFNNFIKEKK